MSKVKKEVTEVKGVSREDQINELLKGARGTTGNSKSFRELLGDTFSGTKLVTIKNILPVEFGYVYTDPEDENEERPDSATRRVYFGEAKARMLEAGEIITIQGWEAYIALGNMWKEFAINHSGKQFNIVLLDMNAMRKFIDEAYLGLFDPNSKKNKKDNGSKEALKSTSNAPEDLGFSD